MLKQKTYNIAGVFPVLVFPALARRKTPLWSLTY
jgi:hypothetical protein